jgi:NAD(P)-dependent dehydrogenase (short-subunit alcohol dehydrogenase family)
MMNDRTSEGRGRVALVLGGASGIGDACSRLLAKRGWKVAVADIIGERARSVAVEIGGNGYLVDIGDADSVEGLVSAVETEMGAIEAAVVTAAIVQPTPYRPEDFPQAEWDSIIAIDLRGAYLACAAVGRAMLPRRRGAIVTFGSMAAHRSMPLHSYGPAKAGVALLTQNLAAEWGPAGIRINCISPGLTMTPALREAIAEGTRNVDAITQSTALGRLVEPEETAKAVAFLVSDRSSATTGTILPVDAGFLVASSWAMFGGARGSRTIGGET